jgi:hypothetical protein
VRHEGAVKGRRREAVGDIADCLPSLLSAAGRAKAEGPAKEGGFPPPCSAKNTKRGVLFVLQSTNLNQQVARNEYKLLAASGLRSLFFPAKPGKKRVLQSVRVRHFREDFQASRAVKHIVHGKVRGIIVKGMGKCVFRIIPLTYIPLTFLTAFPSSIPPVVAAGRAVFFVVKEFSMRRRMSDFFTSGNGGTFPLFSVCSRGISTKSVWIPMPLRRCFLEPFAPFCGKSSQVTIYQQFTTKIEDFQLRSIKPN